MSAAPMNSAAKSSPRRTFPRPPNAPATSPEPRASPGPPPSVPTAHSNPPTTSKKFTSTKKASIPQEASIAYCRIGERSSHTWFVLKYLLGINNVKNYDGSWTEYGNLIGAPINNPSGGSSGTK